MPSAAVDDGGNGWLLSILLLLRSREVDRSGETHHAGNIPCRVAPIALPKCAPDPLDDFDVLRCSGKLWLEIPPRLKAAPAVDDFRWGAFAVSPHLIHDFAQPNAFLT